ncbi:MAG: trypsin-like peptidase domain-containing protein, partial [Lentisphaerae bacterium]|nr:trypsin-like peptidase domain-containing protein [Lentisphaerota bacterium]
ESLVPGERFWTETVFDQAVVLEFQAPETADTGGLEATLSKLAHWTLPFESLALLKAGNCHNDVTCSDANWRSTGNGVAGIGTIGDSGVLWCTGTLLNNTRGDFTDYFLTANHCVGSQTEASTTEYYWLYQTPACNGTPPNPTSVPRTGLGADYLQGRNDQTGNDFAFLRLRRRAPGGVTYAGWTASHPGSSAAVKGIHHPDGSFKRISHGAIYGEDVNFWTVRWTSGVTEPGSSGSPLFNSSRQVIGQLWGGYSSCGNPSGLDEYGRFNVTYPLVSAWISPPTWDSGYQDLGSGWRRLAWFGDYVPLGSDGWIWHNRHRFWFASANSGPESLWFFTQDMGWLWTSRSVYPFLYRFNRSVWLWYNGSSNPRWFRNMTTGQWESRP